jgi:predicted ribosomally synthesized peptide with nif11-like leader
MSKQAVEQLLEAASKNTALQQKLEAAGGFADATKIGADNGYSFTEDEAKEVLHERGIALGDGAEGELSEQALEAVAGGTIFDNWRLRLRPYGAW